MSIFRSKLWSRRQLIKQSGIFSVAGAAASISPLATHASSLAAMPLADDRKMPARQGTESHNLYTEIGVRPILNARGTFTIISGSRSLPQVKQAMFEASHYYVHLDELMDAAVGKELGELTGAEWGIAAYGVRSGYRSRNDRMHRRYGPGEIAGAALHQKPRSGHHPQAFA